MATKKKWYEKPVGIVLMVFGIVGTVGGGIFAIMELGADRKDIETRIFTDAEMKVKTEEWVNSPHNEVELYKIAQENLNQTKINIEAKKEFDSAFVFVQDVLENDIEDKLHRIKSRNVRDSLAKVQAKNDSIASMEIRSIKRELQLQAITNDLILKNIKEIKDSIK